MARRLPNDEVLGAWLAKESVRDVYLTDDPDEAATLLDKTIAGCRTDDVAEIRSLGDTLARWRTEILAHHTTGASNGPTEGLNLLVKEVKRCGRGFENFELPAPRPPPNRQTDMAQPAHTTHPQNASSPRSRRAVMARRIVRLGRRSLLTFGRDDVTQRDETRSPRALAKSRTLEG